MADQPIVSAAKTIINLGNTHTTVGSWIGAGWANLRTIDTQSFKLDMVDLSHPVLVASVVPAWSAELQKHKNVRLLSPAHCSGRIDFSLVDASTIGADRVANAIALAEFYPLPALVIDCGTAITIEIVDEQRRFRGGAIAPGRSLMRRALNSGTAQLPSLPLYSQIFDRPGCDTANSLRFGIDCGAIGMVRELLAQCRRQYAISSCCLTGGDAEFFAAAMPELIKTPADFTLQGIRLGMS